jgi:tetratricopeptide (TPR) repeat protein
MNNLAEVLESQSKYEEAEKIHRQTLELKEKVLGRDHPYTLRSMKNLVWVLQSQGKFEEAREIQAQYLFSPAGLIHGRG